jgi:hypothetical protein
VVRWLDELHKEIKSKTKKSMPLWITEIGWPNHDGWGGSTEAMTAQRLLKMSLLLASRGYVRGTWWYDLFDDGPKRSEQEDNFGLIRIDGVRKPAYQAYQLFLAQFAKARFVKDVSAENAIGLEFKSADGRRLVAVWAREGSQDKLVSARGTWRLIPVEGGDNERLEAELKKSGAARLGQWPAIFELSKDARVRITAQSILSNIGCAR